MFQTADPMKRRTGKLTLADRATRDLCSPGVYEGIR
ncbi:MAG: hypothetical protein QG637_358 [Chloroflexota bacterium]|nr:hypothetical protein [Chloroflexota bacterium]